MRLQLVRHATLVVELAGRRLVVDPQLDAPQARPAVENTANDRRNPLVALPEPANRVVEGADAALITHLHGDHLDPTAIELLPWGLPLLCQPEDEAALREHGFTTVTPVPGEVELDGLTVARTPARHGLGEIGEAMAPASGFVLRATGEPVLYVAGDSVWCDEVGEAIDRHAPDVVVVNAGAAQFTEGGPITMTARDVARVAERAPAATVVVVHLEAVNHCLEPRDAYRDLGDRVLVPADGDRLEL